MYVLELGSWPRLSFEKFNDLSELMEEPLLSKYSLLNKPFIIKIDGSRQYIFSYKPQNNYEFVTAFNSDFMGSREELKVLRSFISELADKQNKPLMHVTAGIKDGEEY